MLDWIGLGRCWGESVGCPIGEGTKKGKRKQIGERRVEWRVGPTLLMSA